MDLTAVVVAAGVAAVGLGAAAIAKVLGYEVDIGISPPRIRISKVKSDPAESPAEVPRVEPPPPSGETEAERERAQLRQALFDFSETAQALNALLVWPPGQRDTKAREWFDFLAVGLEYSLRTSKEERYRVSIWASRGDAEYFDAVGLGSFGPNDVRMQKLERVGTIGGDAFGSATGETYCADIRDPECGWRQRGNKPPRYRSLFAVALLTLVDERRWGVMTVDCNVVRGFSRPDQQVARHFGELASLGELIWRSKEAPISLEPH